MDMIGYMAEMILVSFLIGAVLGAVIAVHLARPQKQHAADTNEAVAVKVKAKH